MLRQYSRRAALAAGILAAVALTLPGCGAKGPLRAPPKAASTATPPPPIDNPATPPATTSPALPPPPIPSELKP